MELEDLKTKIQKIYSEWSTAEDIYEVPIGNFERSERFERSIHKLIANYCENKGYEVEDYPFQKRILGQTDDYYDADYFCSERNLRYVQVLAATHEDVFNIMYFFHKTFWPDLTGTREEYKAKLLEEVQINSYEIEF